MPSGLGHVLLPALPLTSRQAGFLRTVRGYPGTAGITLAMERGEVQGVIGDDWASLKANKADWLREQKLRILLQLTAARHQDLPDVPLAAEFATSQANARVLALFVERQQYGRPFLAPPGTPPAIVAAYREAFGKVVQDAEFLRETEAARLDHQGRDRRGGHGAGQPHLRQSKADHRAGDGAVAQRVGVVWRSDLIAACFH